MLLPLLLLLLLLDAWAAPEGSRYLWFPSTQQNFLLLLPQLRLLLLLLLLLPLLPLLLLLLAARAAPQGSRHPRSSCIHTQWSIKQAQQLLLQLLRCFTAPAA